MKVASGLAQGRRAEPALATQAVETAMQRAGLSHAQAVLLYLSADFAHDPQPAITAAARAGNCLQVAGCTAAGVFSDEDWVLDAPAAVALVLGDGLSLQTAVADTDPVLTFAAPNALDMHWLMGGGARYGGVSGDASGQGPYTVWSGGRAQQAGRCELALAGADLRVGVSQGIRPLSQPASIGQVEGHDVRMVGGQSALASLARELPLSERAPDRIPTHLLLAGVTYGEPKHALEEGRFHLLPVISANANDRSVTVAGQLTPGLDLFWAMRQPKAAEHDMRAMLDRLSQGANGKPRFGLIFPCMGRGPYFYGGVDRDLQILKERCPGMPFAGFYGNGEIAHLDGANRLLQYSVVLGLGYDAE
ncbi:MAG: FIST C-terminal domain-containing protein [Pseudomonadota bacterium]|nr:FIST C-terminal domain-containing protein [Pseudomonadota bacterium]